RTAHAPEPGRCAVPPPELARLAGPLTLIEVGASAGLCLYPDRYSYRYRTAETGRPRADTVGSGSESVRSLALDPAEGPSSVVIGCALRNTSAPEHIPEVAWRAGIDLNPIDLTESDQRSWLRSLVWPEHDARRRRLTAAAAPVAAGPPS